MASFAVAIRIWSPQCVSILVTKAMSFEVRKEVNVNRMDGGILKFHLVKRVRPTNLSISRSQYESIVLFMNPLFGNIMKIVYSVLHGTSSQNL